LSFNPLLAVMMLAVGAAAMAAGMGDLHCGAARFAFKKHLLAGLSAAAAHGPQSLTMARQKLFSMKPLKLWLVALNEMRQSDHD
jgi:hypothetical protein